MIVYCFGDSITQGEYDAERGGWAERLKAACMARHLAGSEPEVSVFNLGIGGETTRLMRSRMRPELERRLDAGTRALVTLAYGAVDSAESGESLLVPRDEYVGNLAFAIDEARHLGCEVRLLTVTPVAPAADGVRSRSGRLRSNAVVASYNDALAELSRRKSAALIDVNAALRAHELSSLFVADGVHPNARGHELIYQLVREQLLGE